MAVLAITIKSESLDYVANQLRDMPKKIPQAIANAMNAGLRSGQSAIVRGVKKVVTITDKDRIIKDTMIRKATPSNLSASVTITGRPIGALQFKHTVVKGAGATLTAFKSQGTQIFPGGFKGIGASNNAHLFMRIRGTSYHVGSRAHHKPNIGRNMEKIRPIYGPKLSTIYSRNPQIKMDATAKSQKSLTNRLLSQVDRFLDRKKADRPAIADTLLEPE